MTDSPVPPDDTPPRPPVQGPPKPALLKLNRIRATRRNPPSNPDAPGTRYIVSDASGRRIVDSLIRLAGGPSGYRTPTRLSDADFAPPSRLPVEPNPELVEVLPVEGLDPTQTPGESVLSRIARRLRVYRDQDG